jgi:ABC-type uncharacterized transport system permease subunit
MIQLILGWLVWVFAALVALFLLSGSANGAVRFVMRTQATVLIIGLVATAFFPVSKFHLLWVFPLAFIVPMLILNNRASQIANESDQRIDAARRAGVPIGQAIEQEAERLRKMSAPD